MELGKLAYSRMKDCLEKRKTNGTSKEKEYVITDITNEEVKQ